MKHEILSDGRLKITADPQEVTDLRYQREQNESGEPNGWGTHVMEADVLEDLIANSELQWLAEGSTGDLTSAPLLGILGEETATVAVNLEHSFGLLVTGHNGTYEMTRPIIARWAYMNYQVRSFLDDLADTGESIWDGGYAFPAGMRDSLARKSIEPPGVTETASLQSRPIVRVKYYGDTEPKIEVDPLDSVTVELIDGEEESMLFLDHGGVQIYITMQERYPDMVSENYYSYIRGVLDDSVDAFSIEDLPDIAMKNLDKYQEMYPGDRYKQWLANAIDVGFLTKDGLSD